MTTTSEKEFIVSLELTPQLIEEQTVERFDFNANLNQGFLKLNGVHNEIPLITFPITLDKYDEVKNEDIEFLIKKLAEEYNIESYDITSIVEVFYIENNKQNIKQTVQDYHTWKLLQDSEQQQEESTEQEYETVSKTIRKHMGPVWTRGTITGISKVSVMISKVSYYCDICQKMRDIEFPFPVNNTKFVKKKCGVCDEDITNNFNPTYINAVTVELQNTETFNQQQMDRLPVYLFDENTENILVNETVEIMGRMKVDSDGKKMFTCLYADSIRYVNKTNVILSDDDVKEIEEFAAEHGANTIDELVKIYDYSIVGWDHVKKGCLFVAVNTSNKIEDSEHLDALLIGPPGLAKTELLERATEMVPGSSMESAEKASGKTLTAVVEKSDNGTFLRIGIIPGARDGICGLDEIGEMSFEHQIHLLGIMQKRFFTINKHGINAHIVAPTSIIATCNPKHNADWRHDDRIELDEIPTLRQLTDRFDIIFIFRKPKSKQSHENIAFINELSEVKDKKDKGLLPDKTEFIVKYIRYAKRFNPTLTDGATIMIREFYKQVDLKGYGSPRVLDSLRKITKAVARLKLKDVADEDDAKEAMQFYNVILLNFHMQVVVSQSVKEIAYDACVSILEQGKNFGGITLEELITKICEGNEQLASYFGYGEKSLKMQDNKKVRNLFDLLLNNTNNIKKVQDHPIVLQWIKTTAATVNDLHDLDDPTFNENENEIEEEETITGVRLRKDGPIYFSKDKNEGHEGQQGHQEDQEQEGISGEGEEDE